MKDVKTEVNLLLKKIQVTGNGTLKMIDRSVIVTCCAISAAPIFFLLLLVKKWNVARKHAMSDANLVLLELPV